MPINDNQPNIFDSFVTEITRNLDEVLETVRNNFTGPTEDSVDEGTEETPEADDDLIDIDEEIIRLLEKAELAADRSGDSEQSNAYLSIVDRLMIIRREV